VLISSCSTGVRFDPVSFFGGNKPDQVCESFQQLTDGEAHALLNADIYELQHSVERSLVYREEVAERLSYLDSFTQGEEPFPPAMIDQLSRGVKKQVGLMRPIMKNVAKHGCWVNYEEYDVSQSVKLKGGMTLLATLVALYDDYGTVFAVINENDRLRRFLNNEDIGYGRDAYQLESLTNLFINEDLLSYTSELIEKYHENKDKIKGMAGDDNNLYYLVQIIEQSKSYPLLLEMDFFDAASYRRKVRRNVASDTLSDIGRAIVNGLSEGFSNAVGEYEERKGLLYDDIEVGQYVAGQLKMGDILLEKTPFRLTDSMIPGHWGHAAIWIGTEQELRSIGLWEHPLVKRYHAQIKRGELVAESLRTGTQLNPLSHFMNIDDLGVIRSRQPLTEAEMRDTIILALRQIGKEYDFNFDVETTDKIVCSQLVYLAYNKIQWPTESVVGRYTISPDNIAIKALDDGPLDLVLFYHDGKRVEEDQLLLMEALMRQE
jgi:uncharacterized protein YycO